MWSFIGTIKGDDGEAAAAGADGKTWYSGTAVPATALGVIGDLVFKNFRLRGL